MVKKILLIIALFLGVGVADVWADKSSWLSWWPKKEDVRIIEVINDIPELIGALPEETEEFQESIDYTVEINGTPIEPGRLQLITIHGDQFVITVKSKLPFSEHISASKRFKGVIKKADMMLATHYGFTCHVNPDIKSVNLALPVLYGCNALKENGLHTVSYKWPLGITICLNEIIECF